ncbi:MAG: nuclear transport factor 2 family protein [Bacillota bacterium]|nr:nuclear transport factor 2 family protein [Bacillota bacterium]
MSLNEKEKKTQPKSKRIVLIISACVVFLGMATGLIIWQSQITSKEDTPEKLMTRFCKAMNDKDVNGYLDCYDPAFVKEGEAKYGKQTFIDDNKQGLNSQKDFKATIKNEVINGNTATISYSYTMTLVSSGKTSSQTITVQLARENGKWYIKPVSSTTTSSK